GEYLPGSLQGKISSDGCLKKEQMVVSAIASTPHSMPLLSKASQGREHDAAIGRKTDSHC
ncbi:hypothetical protein, partial [Shigella sonnei]